MKYFCFLFVLFFIGCEQPTDDCEVGEMRCNGQTLEVCNSLVEWECRYVCPDFGLVCCETEEAFDCLEQCED